MTTSTLDLPALKALAEQATPGEWIACQMSHFERGGDLTPDELGEYVANAVRKSQAASGSSRFLFVSVMKADGPADVCLVGNGPTSPANAAFIAAANPATVLALLAEVERLRQGVDVRDAMLRDHANAAACFQPGGDLHARANLPLGSSAVVGGIEWLRRALKQAEVEVERLRLRLDELYSLAEESKP